MVETAGSADDGALGDARSSVREIRYALWVTMTFALCVRLAVVVLFAVVVRGREFNDDFYYYEIMLHNPFVLLTGSGVERVGGGVIYSPLVPLEVAVPGLLFVKMFGLSVGHRLGMICYDMAATGLSLWAAFRAVGVPRTGVQWVGALTLATMPAAVLSSAAWGQEDTICAFWSGSTMVAALAGWPVLAAAIAATGLFTSKLFSLLLLAGVWIGSRGSRWRISLVCIPIVVAFVVFTVVRNNAAGVKLTGYRYDVIGNAPSLYAAYSYLVRPVGYDDVQLIMKGVAVLLLAAVSVLLLLRSASAIASVVALHATFFITFIGIQPEHQQWVLPFFIFMAWTAFRQWGVRGGGVLITVWGYGAAAYGFKIAYGLAGTAGAGGKDVFRSWYAAHIAIPLSAVRMVMLLLTLALGLTVGVLALRGRGSYRLPQHTVVQ